MPACCLDAFSDSNNSMSPIQQQNVSPARQGVLGHLPAFKKDPLGFLSDCADGNQGVVTLRMLHKSVFLLLDPADIERVLVTDNRNYIKPAWLRTPAVHRLLGDGLVTSEGEAWSKQRHACRPAFEPRRMEDYGEAMSTITVRAMANWSPGMTIDILREMSRITMAIVGSLFFLANVDETDWITDAGEAMDTLMHSLYCGRIQFLWDDPATALPNPRYMASRRLNAVVDRLVRRHEPRHQVWFTRFVDGIDLADLLSLLKTSVAASGNQNKQQALREQVKTFLTAGHESSAIAVSWAFLLLAQYPDVEELMKAELRTTLCGRPPVFSDLRNLPYTQAIVQEALRLYPPLWMTGRQSVQPCDIGCVSIPAGSLVMTSQWAVHRLPKLFRQPTDFRPERWLNGETDGLPRCAYFPFGAGPRTCIGLGIAMMESALMLAAIAQRFKLTRTDDRPIQPWATMTLRPPLGIQMRLEKNT